MNKISLTDFLNSITNGTEATKVLAILAANSWAIERKIITQGDYTWPDNSKSTGSVLINAVPLDITNAQYVKYIKDNNTALDTITGYTTAAKMRLSSSVETTVISQLSAALPPEGDPFAVNLNLIITAILFDAFSSSKAKAAAYAAFTSFAPVMAQYKGDFYKTIAHNAIDQVLIDNTKPIGAGLTGYMPLLAMAGLAAWYFLEDKKTTSQTTETGGI